MQSYTIRISEQQRAHIVAALRAANLPVSPDNDELHLLISMLDDMPQIELDHPGVLHGLCL